MQTEEVGNEYPSINHAYQPISLFLWIVCCFSSDSADWNHSCNIYSGCGGQILGEGIWSPLVSYRFLCTLVDHTLSISRCRSLDRCSGSFIPLDDRKWCNFSALSISEFGAIADHKDCRILSLWDPECSCSDWTWEFYPHGEANAIDLAAHISDTIIGCNQWLCD